MKFELSNDQRKYFGLEPIEPEWDRVILKGDSYREESILYFDGDVIKRYIISTESQYKECQYYELTRSRIALLPTTGKGREKKLTASVLESRQPTGIYCVIESTGRILIGNFNTQTKLYDSFWEKRETKTTNTIQEWVNEFIETTPNGYIEEITEFKKRKRKNIKYKSGDFFAFKINREEYGFGRVILDIDLLKKKNFISKGHGLSFIMAKPILVQIYAYISKTKKIDIDELEKNRTLPSDYMMDNLLYYGEYEIIGHKELAGNDFDFPISYGRNIDFSKNTTFFQWGLIHRELPISSFNKFLFADNPLVPIESPSRKVTNPYGYYSIGFNHKYWAEDIKDAVKNNGEFDFSKHLIFKSIFDLRNTVNKEIRNELMKSFGLNPNKNYVENCELTKTIKISEVLKKL